MLKEDFKLTNKDDTALFKAITTTHAKYFTSLQAKIQINTKAKSFISNTIGDYIWDMNNSFCENPNFQLGWYFNGNVKSYATQLLNDIINAKNAIINLYLLYNYNKNDFEDIRAEYEENKEFNTYISDVSLDYYNIIGGSVCTHPEPQEILALTNQELKELNSILKEYEFNPVSISDIKTHIETYQND